MNKRLIFVLLLVVVLLLSTACSPKTKNDVYAQIVLPDGTIVEGVSTYQRRNSRNWVSLTIGGKLYHMHESRVVIWEELLYSQ